MFTLAVATLSTNIAANVVSPSYDFSNLWPSKISFRTGGLITGVIGILIFPWELLANSSLYIFTWLGTYGGATGAIAGVLIADYWLIRRTHLNLKDLYTADGIYRYASGWNWRAVVALLVGIVFAIGGSYSTIGADGKSTGPFPADGIIPSSSRSPTTAGSSGSSWPLSSTTSWPRPSPPGRRRRPPETGIAGSAGAPHMAKGPSTAEGPFS